MPQIYLRFTFNRIIYTISIYASHTLLDTRRSTQLQPSSSSSSLSPSPSSPTYKLNKLSFADYDYSNDLQNWLLVNDIKPVNVWQPNEYQQLSPFNHHYHHPHEPPPFTTHKDEFSKKKPKFTLTFRLKLCSKSLTDCGDFCIEFEKSLLRLYARTRN